MASARVYPAIVFVAAASTVGCARPDSRPVEDLRPRAEQYFSAVFGCRSELVDTLVSDSIVASYPIYETVLGTPAIRGRDAVRRFAERFCGRWAASPEITIHEAVQDGHRVALVWGFSAVPVSGSSPDGSNGAAPQTWGGITFLRFDAEGKVMMEVGEESAPGPMARIAR